MKILTVCMSVTVLTMHWVYILQVILLWRRAVQNVQLVFSLVHAERLSFSVCEKALQQLDIITQGQGGILLSHIDRFQYFIQYIYFCT